MYKIFSKILKTKKDLTPDEYKKINPFLMNNWLSGDRLGLVLADVFNKYENIPMENRVQLIRGVLQPNVKYIKYPKSTIQKDKYIENISKYYNINYELAKEYYETMPEEQAIQITKYLNDTGGRIK